MAPPSVLDAANVTDICLHEGRLLGARGAELWDLGAARSVGSFDAAISALAAADGRLAVAVAGQGNLADRGRGLGAGGASRRPAP